MKILSVGAVVSVSLLVCGALGFFWPDLERAQAPSISALDHLLGVDVRAPKQSGEAVFQTNYESILGQYVSPVKPQNLKYAGIEGMLASLGDPHTVFFPPREAAAFSDETQANFFGVGARLSPDPLGARVASVFTDGPAYAAGLRKGNIITGVDGVSMAGKDINVVVSKIKGKEGTIVRLTIVQAGKQKPVTISIKRARIIAPTVEGSVLPNTTIGYLIVTQFSEPTASQFADELAKVERKGIKGLIIDLRGNPGGLLDTAKQMLSMFVQNKVVVTMKMRGGREEVARTDSGELHEFNYPVVLLVDQDSASAAEIFSGCLHDYGKATLVGTTTYGKASVQSVFPLIDGSSAKITIAKYFLPDGEYIGRTVDSDGVKLSGGLAPDVPVKLTTDELVTFGDPKTDNQLAKAIQVVDAKE